jgi:hypothetical protein
MESNHSYQTSLPTTVIAPSVETPTLTDEHKRLLRLQWSLQLLSIIFLIAGPLFILFDEDTEIGEAIWLGILGVVGYAGASRMSAWLLGLEIALSGIEVATGVLELMIIPGMSDDIYFDLIIHTPLMLLSVMLYRLNIEIPKEIRNWLRGRPNN